MLPLIRREIRGVIADLETNLERVAQEEDVDLFDVVQSARDQLVSTLGTSMAPRHLCKTCAGNGLRPNSGHVACGVCAGNGSLSDGPARVTR